MKTTWVVEVVEISTGARTVIATTKDGNEAKRIARTARIPAGHKVELTLE